MNHKHKTETYYLTGWFMYQSPIYDYLIKQGIAVHARNSKETFGYAALTEEEAILFTLNFGSKLEKKTRGI